MINLHAIQKAQKAWADRNFGSDTPAYRPLLGAIEELGELCHHRLKYEQGIRNTENHMEEMRDAVGDINIYLMHFCSLLGWDYEEIIKTTWEQVAKRDWQKHPDTAHKIGDEKS